MTGYQGYRTYGDYSCVPPTPAYDPAALIQMQAQYLRLLADMYAEPPRPSNHSRAKSHASSSAKVDAGVGSFDSPVQGSIIAKSLPGSHKREEEGRRSLDEVRNPREEKPIHGVTKKFEEFLEEEMRKEQTEVTNPQNQKHEFLKRRSQSVPFQLRASLSKTKPEESKDSELEVSFSPDHAKSPPRKPAPVKKDPIRPSSQSPTKGETDLKKALAETQSLRAENESLRAKIEELEAKIREMTKAEQPTSDSSRGTAVKLKKVTEEMAHSRSEVVVDGKAETTAQRTDGVKEVLFKKGGKKMIYPDGRSTVQFKNGDVKDVYPDGRIVYQFSQTNTVQTTFPDGLQIFKFSNGQLEKHFPDKTKEINFPDGTVKKINQSGIEETIFPDGTVQRIDERGVKHIDYVNGQKETVHADGTRIREMPDGSVKTIPPKKQ